jgi:membrane protein required for beta-lactamase induction
LFLVVPGASIAQEVETPAEATVSAQEEQEPATAEQPSPPQELYVVSQGEEPGTLAEVQEIYRDSDRTFAAVFWYWLLAIVGLAGLGALAWFIWGRRGPPRISGR